MKAFKDGNKAYAASDWRVAAEKYEEAAQLTASDPACEWCPAIYFYLGNSYDNMYRPARKGEPANDELLQKAVDNYKLASEKLTEETQPKRSLALEFLVAAYGPDKLADPTQAEPVVQAHDRTGAERADQLLPAREDLRRLGRVPAGRGNLPQGPRRQAERPDGLHDGRPATTTARATSTSWSRTSGSASSSSRKIPRRTTRWRPTTGTRRRATSASPTRKR